MQNVSQAQISPWTLLTSLLPFLVSQAGEGFLSCDLLPHIPVMLTAITIFFSAHSAYQRIEIHPSRISTLGISRIFFLFLGYICASSPGSGGSCPSLRVMRMAYLFTSMTSRGKGHQHDQGVSLLEQGDPSQSPNL